MKLHIEVELEPDEMPAAVEIVEKLKTMVSDLKVRQSSEKAKPATPKLSPQVEVPAVAAATNEGSSPKAQNNVFTGPLTTLRTNWKNPTAGDGFLTSVAGIIGNKIMEGAPLDLVAEEYSIAFMNTVVVVPASKFGHSVVPFLSLTMRLPEQYLMKIRDCLLGHLLAFLAMKRPISCDRTDIFYAAETFAAFTKFQLIDMNAAIGTMCKFAESKDQVAAAITMLGKTVELCFSVLKEKDSAEHNLHLKRAFSTVQHESFKYDLDYIAVNLGWNLLQDQGSTGSSNAMKGGSSGGDSTEQKQKLVFKNSFQETGSDIYALGYDAVGDSIIAACKDGTVVSRSRDDGSVRESFELPGGNYYSCALDASNKSALILCGMGKVKNTLPSIFLYSRPDLLDCYDIETQLTRETMKLISCVRSMPGDGDLMFVTAESEKDKKRDVLCLYDGSSLRDSSVPIHEFDGHMDVITSIAACSPTLVGSGSRDATLRLWDTRSKSQVFSLPHSFTVTSVDCAHESEWLLVSGSMHGRNGKLMVWDIRNPVSPISAADFNAPVIKIAAGKSVKEIAIATMAGIYLHNAVDGAFSQAVSNEERPPRAYDMKWNAVKDTLFVAGETGRIDLYQ